MAWMARNKNNVLHLYAAKPCRQEKHWEVEDIDLRYKGQTLRYDHDEVLFGIHITWEDEPVEIEIK